MEDINALNNKLQSISRTLEAAQSLAHQQEEAIRGCMKERERREQQRISLNEQLTEAVKKRDDIALKFESEIAISTHLEIDYQSAQIMFSHIPALIAKECNDYERFCKKVSTQIRSLHRMLHDNELWTDQQNDANSSLIEKKQQFINERNSAKEECVRKEEHLRSQLEVEETKLAYLEYCANSMAAAEVTASQACRSVVAAPPRQVTPTSAHKTPTVVQGGKFTLPYPSSSAMERSAAGSARIAAVTSHTLPAVSPTPRAPQAAAANPFSDWEDRAPASPRTSAAVPPPAAAALKGSAQSGTSQVKSLLANYAPCYPRAQQIDDTATECAGQQRGGASDSVCDGGDDSMDVDYDFTVPTPPQTPPQTPRDAHQPEHGFGGPSAIELSISTTTTTVTEYTMQRMPIAGYRSAFLCDTDIGATPARAPSPSASRSYSEFQRHHRGNHPSQPLPLPTAVTEESYYSHEDYEEQTRLCQQEVPWFKEFKRRRAGPGPQLGNDVHSSFTSYSRTAPIPESRVAEVPPVALTGNGPHGAVSGAGLSSHSLTPVHHQPLQSNRLPPRHHRDDVTASSASAAQLFIHSGAEGEVIDLYDTSDSGECDEDTSIHPAASSSQSQDMPQTSFGTRTGAAFRSHHAALNMDQAGLNTRHNHFSGVSERRAGRDDDVVGRRGFRSGLDIMQAAHARQLPSAAQMVSTDLAIIDD